MSVVHALSWGAVICLSVSYWFQIWRIHVHKEVRDLSLPYHILLLVGFATLALTAYIEGSVIFLVKQITTTIPVVVIIGQIFYHRQDHWHDENAPLCASCNAEREEHWIFCPYCGAEETLFDK